MVTRLTECAKDFAPAIGNNLPSYRDRVSPSSAACERKRESIMTSFAGKSPLNAALGLVAASALVTFLGISAASALTPPSSAAPQGLAMAPGNHALILAQATERTESNGAAEEKKGVEEEQRGIEEERRGMEEERKGVEEERGMKEEEKEK